MPRQIIIEAKKCIINSVKFYYDCMVTYYVRDGCQLPELSQTPPAHKEQGNKGRRSSKEQGEVSEGVGHNRSNRSEECLCHGPVMRLAA